MAGKKESEIALSAEDTNDIQHIVDTYAQIAQDVRASSDQAQVETVLQPINALSEPTQIALLKTLAKIAETDVADILVAINAFSPSKEVRKEARRSLIRLEATKTYPHWSAPITPAAGIQVNVPNPPRFWKGVIAQTREQGEVPVLLAWEQGYDYSETRSIRFLLDFWKDGIKDVVVEVGGKRHVEESIDEMRMHIDAPIVDCNVAEAKRLIEEALSINEWYDTVPAKEYRTYLPTIKQLILQAPDPGVDRGRTYINSELMEQEVIVNFIGSWSWNDFGLSYDLLTTDAAPREGMTRDEWIERHRAWAKESHPVRLQLGFVHEREQTQQSTLWLPSAPFAGRPLGRKEIEVGWSLELHGTPLSGTLDEMPMGTAVNKETDRHWFWSIFTLIKQDNSWRIQRIADEGANIQGLAVEELQKRIKDYDAALEAVAKKSSGNHREFVQEAAWRLAQTLHFYDALIARLPLDRQICEDAYNHAVATGSPEHTLVYLDRLVNNFSDNKVDVLRRLGATLASLGFNYDNIAGMQERQDHLIARAESTFREAIALNDDAVNRSLLAELYLSQERNDEAEQELLRAKELITSVEEEASVEVGLGSIAMRRELMSEALPHFERVAELKPNYTGIWFSIGFAQRLLGRLDAAAESYKRAILLQANDYRPYSELIAIYMNQKKETEARDIAAQGIRNNPDSARLHALYASALLELGDRRNAQRMLEQAEAIDPEDEVTVRVGQMLNDATKKK